MTFLFLLNGFRVFGGILVLLYRGLLERLWSPAQKKSDKKWHVSGAEPQTIEYTCIYRL